ncbi:hypothetical protein TNIN_227161 [Trichonephila inaurata madagascariensis]|uniref:Uncharacterized protein n=1 Tax=Trichonephila inaurata madagascariensis TaxID=2747483 RepID=A0A8X6YN07_9ARAC|nr:hypothetical protein TNIN_227161 [Trichonephila inaurata madagascariensis]
MPRVLYTERFCKDLLLAPGNRSNDTHEIWQRAHYIQRRIWQRLGRPDRKGPKEVSEKTEDEKKRGRRKEDGWTMDYNLVPS